MQKAYAPKRQRFLERSLYDVTRMYVGRHKGADVFGEGMKKAQDKESGNVCSTVVASMMVSKLVWTDEIDPRSTTAIVRTRVLPLPQHLVSTLSPMNRQACRPDTERTPPGP